MAKHNDNIARYERRDARRWTRATDYWPDANSGGPAINWTGSRPISDFAVTRRSERPSVATRRGFALSIAVVALAAAFSLWGSGILERGERQSAVSATTSKGLVFGLCSEGGLTNCVASGDSFYLGGKNVRIAGIEAPQLYGSACPKEAALGQNAAVRLQRMLNSGELELTRIPQDLDRFGLLLRNVAVDGKDVGRTMVREGLAREIGDITRNWC